MSFSYDDQFNPRPNKEFCTEVTKILVKKLASFSGICERKEHLVTTACEYE